jgi:hypothetical protein
MLRRGVGASRPSAVPNGCVDGETLAAWSSGALAPDASARVEEHLADCARCQSMLAAYARSEPLAAAAAPWWKRGHAPWLIPLATAATVAAIWIAIPQRAETPQPNKAEGTASELRFQNEPRVTLNQPAPSVSAQSAPSTAQTAIPRREARAAPEQKQEATGRRADAADARTKASGQPANERVAAAPPATAPPVAPPAAATLSESIAQDAVTRQAARGTGGEIISPGGATRWRIIGGLVQRSTTPGASWETVTLPPATITAGHSPADSVVWLVGRAGVIFVTTDGTRFEQVPFVSSADLASVVAVDAQQATVTTVDGRRFRTADRGVTWVQP